MTRPAQICGILFVVSLCFMTATTSAAGKKKRADKPDPARTVIESVLKAEFAGPVDRRRELEKTIAASSDSAGARGQGGYARDGGLWRSYDDPPLAAAGMNHLAEYRARRETALQTPRGQLDLANWCRKKGLIDQ